MATEEQPQGRYAPVNGLNVYYELYGKGQDGRTPLVVLHGAFMTIEAMGELIPQLAANRQVIAVELQGHSHTADVDRPMRFESLAEDVAALLAHLGIAHADLFGFSMGGGVALQTTIRHPNVVRKVVIASAPCKRAGWYPESLAGMEAISVEAFAGTPIQDAYLKTSPMPEAWPQVVDKVRALVTSDYDWTEQVMALHAPALIVLGDADGIQLTHAAEFFGMLGGGKGDGDLAGLSASRLAILPSTTHVGWAPPYHGMLTRTGLLAPIVAEFLDAPMPEMEAS